MDEMQFQDQIYHQFARTSQTKKLAIHGAEAKGIESGAASESPDGKSTVTSNSNGRCKSAATQPSPGLRTLAADGTIHIHRPSAIEAPLGRPTRRTNHDVAAGTRADNKPRCVESEATPKRVPSNRYNRAKTATVSCPLPIKGKTDYSHSNQFFSFRDTSLSGHGRLAAS